MIMNVNTISSINNYGTQAYGKTEKKTSDNADTVNRTAFTEQAAIYEHTAKTETTAKAGNTDIIAQMKKDTAERMAQMQSLVEKLFMKQGQSFLSADEMIKALANGELKVDEETANQAQKDISEDGYWGVEQTSDRIFDFAMALSGGDEEKMKNMLSAFEKGYNLATKSWGKELPSLCKDTYDAVEEKFDKFFNPETEETTSQTEA